MTGAGDRGNVEALFQRYYRPLVAFANTYVHRLEEAEDIVQEQFVKSWDNGSLGRVAAGAMATYLFTVVKNACLNFLEKKRVPAGSLEPVHYRIAREEAEAMDDEAAAAIMEALRALPLQTRRVVELVILEERGYKEAAGELGVSINTVKTLLRLGLRTLRERLGERRFLFLFFSAFRSPVF
jgi:RNA polymerase sigma-70 factor (ECF subfamily)